MGEAGNLKYRAFLSYAHADSAWGRWVHRQLESYRPDKELIGRSTAQGAVPATLSPIFRDREDFAGGHSLSTATIRALDQSAALLVLCSPASATRPAVNEEVRLFRHRHPDRPVIPIVLSGESPANFPTPLRFEINLDGSLSDRPITILGVDLRKGADGTFLGMAKLVAGLTGLSTDEIVRRADRNRRRRFQSWTASISCVAMVLAALAVWAEINRRQAVEQRTRADDTARLTVQSTANMVRELATDTRSWLGVQPQIGLKILVRAQNAVLGTIATAIRAGIEVDSESMRQLGIIQSEIAATQDRIGDHEAALKSFDIARTTLLSAMKKDEQSLPLTVDYFIVLSRIIDIYYENNRLDEALKSVDMAEKELLAAKKIFGSKLDRRRLFLLERKGYILSSLDKKTDALSALREVAVMRRSLLDQRTGYRDYWEASAAYFNLSNFSSSRTEKVSALDDAEKLFAEGSRIAATNSSYVAGLDLEETKVGAGILIAKAELLLEAGDFDAAKMQYDKAFRFSERLMREPQLNISIADYIGRAKLNVAEKLFRLQRSVEGATYIEGAKEIYGKLARQTGRPDFVEKSKKLSALYEETKR